MRYWTTESNTGGDLHVMGNGRLLVYGSGPDILSIQHGYSGDILCSLSVSMQQETGSRIQCMSERREGRGEWEHRLSYSNLLKYTELDRITAAVTLIDYVDQRRDILVREYRSLADAFFRLTVPPGVKLYDLGNYRISQGVNRTLLLIADGDTLDGSRLYLTLAGNTEYVPENQGIFLRSGTGSLIFSAGTPADALRNTAYILRVSRKAREENTRYWNKQLLPVRERASQCAHLTDDPDRFLAAAENALSLLLIHQAESGGILADCSNRMCGLSEQYGAIRGLLAADRFEEARQALLFWHKRFYAFGRVRRYEPLSGDRHGWSSSDDRIGLPAYLILAASDYYEATRDIELIRTLLPLLRQAFDDQNEAMNNGCPVWNGEEKEVTCFMDGVRPLYTGSAVNTALFIASAERMYRLLNLFPQSKKGIRPDKLLALRDHYAALYSRTFLKNGILYADYPQQKVTMKRTRFVYGICPHCQQNGRQVYPMWLERMAGDTYLCPHCALLSNRKQKEFPEEQGLSERHIYLSSGLLPLYLGVYSLKDDLTACLTPFLDGMRRSTHLFSAPGSDICLMRDAGMLLRVLAAGNHPDTRQVFNFLMNSFDKTHNLPEYLRKRSPAGVRCPSEETGIALDALLAAGPSLCRERELSRA